MTLFEEQQALARICAGMTRTGIRLDTGKLAEVRAQMACDKAGVAGRFPLTAELIEKLDGSLPKKMGKDFAKGKPVFLNLNSGKQVIAYFKTRGLTLPNTQIGTIKDWTERSDDPELHDLLDYKNFGKGVDAWFGDEYITDGRLHPRWNPTGTVERRLSCSRPNFQNVPHRNSYFSNLMRSVVIPEEGCLLVELDASAGEDWSTAFAAGDKKLLDELATGIDIHSRTAQYAFDCEVHKCSQNQNQEMYLMRDGGKRANHMHKYGQGFKYCRKRSGDERKMRAKVDAGLALVGWEGEDYVTFFTGFRMAEIVYGSGSNENQRRALKVKQQLMEDYGSLLEWQIQTFETWKRTNYVKNPFGFGRPLYGDPEECFKRALAFIGASTLQTTVIRAMIDMVQEGLYKLRPHVFLHGQIHDSLLLSVYQDHTGLIDGMKDICERSRDGFRVPWEVQKGERWNQLS